MSHVIDVGGSTDGLILKLAEYLVKRDFGYQATTTARFLVK